MKRIFTKTLLCFFSAYMLVQSVLYAQSNCTAVPAPQFPQSTNATVVMNGVTVTRTLTRDLFAPATTNTAATPQCVDLQAGYAWLRAEDFASNQSVTYTFSTPQTSVQVFLLLMGNAGQPASADQANFTVDGGGTLTLTHNSTSFDCRGAIKVDNTKNSNRVYVSNFANNTTNAAIVVSSTQPFTSLTITNPRTGVYGTSTDGYGYFVELCPGSLKCTTPPTPTITTTAASCSAGGTAKITNYSSAYTYTFSPAGPSVGAGGAITALVAGTNYTVTAGSGTCVSAASTQFKTDAQLPSAEISGNATVKVGQTSQLIGSGTKATTNPWISSASSVATVNSTGLVTGVAPGTATITYTNSSGCQSSVLFTVNADVAANDRDGDGIPDNEDLDNDNDGIPDVAEAFSCGLENANFRMAGTVTAYDFQAATLNTFSNVTAGNASAQIIATYNFGTPNSANMTAVGKIVEATGPYGTTTRLIAAQKSIVSNKETENSSTTGVYNFAFRAGEGFTPDRLNRKFVIEYDFRTESDRYNEFGTYISNGQNGTVYVNSAGTYNAYATYRGQLWKQVNGVRTILPTTETSITGWNDYGNWYHFKTEYMLTNSTTLKIVNTMYKYNSGVRSATPSGTTTFIETITLDGGQAWLKNFQAGVLADHYFDNVEMYWAECDTDGDGIPNRFDVDSDNDGCPDALEGSETVRIDQIHPLNLPPSDPNYAYRGQIKVTYDGITTNIPANIVSTSANAKGIPQLVNNAGNNHHATTNPGNLAGVADATDGSADIGQGIGTSQDATQKDIDCSRCFKPATTTGTAQPAQHGITALGRAGADNGNWPMKLNGAYTVLDAKTKGFVINRLTTIQINALTAVKGMAAYDTTEQCLKIYNGTAWQCYNTQTCDTP